MIIKKQVKAPIEKKESIDINQSSDFSVENEKLDVFDIDKIDFSQRQERRRGDRRRGYRRIDDRNLISRAREEAETIKESAAKEGYNSGVKKAQEDIVKLKDSILEFLHAKQDVFEYIAPDILEISIDIARKIVKKEIEQDPEVVLQTILDVLKDIAKEDGRVSIKVNPSQVLLVKESLPDIITSAGIEARITVSQDENIDVGGCIIYTNNGVVDATISTQIEIIKDALKGI